MKQQQRQGVLTTNEIMEAGLYRRTNLDVDEINGFIGRLEKEVWFGKSGLQRDIENWEFSFYEAKFDDMQVLIGITAGRVMITMSMNDDMLTLVADETDGGGCGLHGINASKEDAINLINKFRTAWQYKKVNFEKSDEVWFG